MIVRNLIKRPIAVTMSLIALLVIGFVSFGYIPVSLMPNIDIPQITVQVSYPGASVREVDAKVVRPLRNQLMQVSGLKDIRSESKMDAGAISMTFEPGSDIDLIYIEVNEKMDRAMNSMPKELERPKVVKAGAMDIPAFYLNLTLKSEKAGGKLPDAKVDFIELGNFATNIICKRIEQLPQTAMVDVSGVAGTELLCIPDKEKMEAIGITPGVLEKALRENNLTLGVLSVADGIYRYNIHFDSQLTTKEDIENIYINQDGRLFQFKDLCRVEEKPAQRNGLVRSGRNNAVTMAIIKQNDAQMQDLQESIAALVSDMQREYPNVNFELTRDQTQLLTYSMNSLKDNLIIGAVLASLVLFLFMKDFRSPFLIIITIPLSLVVTLLCFHLIGLSLNIISLCGLILGTGMIVDNSIIVIDNSMQKWEKGIVLSDAVVVATNEVFPPMLSSVLTTCSVFIPLIFLDGVSGALFYDQAMAVTIALFSSLFVSVLVIPVYFHLMYRNRTRHENRIFKGKLFHFDFYTPYERILKWTFRHQRTILLGFVFMAPLIAIMSVLIEKKRLPYIAHDDALMIVDWNAGISVKENDERVGKMLGGIEKEIATSTSMIGVQDFLLSHTKELTTSEALVYIKANSETELSEAKSKLLNYVADHYSKAVVSFQTSGNIFDLIFSNNDADLEIRLRSKKGGMPDVSDTRSFLDKLSKAFPNIYIAPISTEENIRYVADLEQMSVYGISYRDLFNRLKELVSQQDLYRLSEGSRYVPVTLGTGYRESRELLQQRVKNAQGTEIPLEYIIKEAKNEDYKKVYSGSGGDYYPIRITANDDDVERIVDYVDEYVKAGDDYAVSFAGNYYESRQQLYELVLVLVVALALLYFILAAQFESLIQPLIILTEVVVDVFWVMAGLYLLGESLNIMSLIGLVVMSGIVINDSILKVDTINRLRRDGAPLLSAIMKGGRSRLKPIMMTSMTTILAILPFLTRGDMGSALQYPLSLAIIIGMSVGTLVSLFFIPVMYYLIYRKKK